MIPKAMNASSKDSTVVAIKEQVSCVVGEEAVILHLKDGTYYGLNAVGAAIWSLIQEPRTVADLREAVQRQFEVGAAQCERDLKSLLESLAKAGLVEVGSGKAA